MDRVLHQKGANGLVAEYQCAVRLNSLLTRRGVNCLVSQGDLEQARDAAIVRVASELSPAQIARAKFQGDCLARYIMDTLLTDPLALGLVIPLKNVLEGSVNIVAVGRSTNSGSSADLRLEIHSKDGTSQDLLISLKAYRGTVSSLGSKGARASLSRLFLDSNRVPDEEFIGFFGKAGRNFVEAFQDFKDIAKEFYASKEGAEFRQTYLARKGKAVNNPLRRKEVGVYFHRKRGYKSEHLFAELYVDMFRHGMGNLADEGSEEHWVSFIEAMKFVLGMDKDILTLNAVVRDDGTLVEVVNSLQSGAYANLRRVLIPGCRVELNFREESSNIDVSVQHGSQRVRSLNLAIWKDATIQFKLDSSVIV